MKQILYFSAKWCAACQQTTPIIEQIKKTNQAQVAIVDVDYDVSLVEKYNVKSVPTTVILENNKEISRHIGKLTEPQLKFIING